jgi:hypothetical protein
MGPVGGQLYIAADAEPLESGITVDLNASEPRQMRSGTLGPTIGTVEIDGRRRISSAPRPVIAGIDPEPASLGATTTGIEHWDRRIIGEQLLRGEHVFGEPCLQRLQPPDGSANPVGEGRAIQLGAFRAKIWLCR